MSQNPYAAPSSNIYGGDSYGNSNAVATSTINILRMTKGWARFLSVLAYIAGTLMVLFALYLLSQAGRLDSLPSELRRELAPLGGGIGIVAVIYIAIAVIAYIIPAIILGGYAGNIGVLLINPSAQSLDAALDKQRSFFKYFGVLAAIGIIFFLLALILGAASVA